MSAAAAGTALCVMVALMAWLLWANVAWVYVAGPLMATETLTFVQSRTSMLDIFLAFFVVLGFLCLLLDRRWIERRTPHPAPALPPGAVAALPPGRPMLSPGPGAMAVDEAAHAEPSEPPAVEVPSPLWRPWRFALNNRLRRPNDAGHRFLGRHNRGSRITSRAVRRGRGAPVARLLGQLKARRQ